MIGSSQSQVYCGQGSDYESVSLFRVAYNMLMVRHVSSPLAGCRLPWSPPTPPRQGCTYTPHASPAVELISEGCHCQALGGTAYSQHSALQDKGHPAVPKDAEHAWNQAGMMTGLWQSAPGSS